MTNPATQSFDRMRSMLVRAAEIRDSEQQQIFDALDEIHARLAPLESLGSVRKRLSEMPDRTEVSVLAERVDEALSKLEAQDSAIAAVARALESIVDKLSAPFAELGGRMDGMAGRFEGVAGRMDGLEDRIAGVQKRIDDLDHHLDRQDARLDALPAAVHGPLSSTLESVTGRLGALDAALAQRPDADSLSGIVRQANDESERRYAAQLDEAMATFAEIIMGGASVASLTPVPPPPPSRPAQRRVRARQTKPVEDSGDAAEGVAS